MVNLTILVFGCHTIPKYKRQIELINETWGKHCNTNINLFYFLEGKSDFVDTEFIKYIHLANVKNDYSSASYKQFLGLKYIYENVKTDFIICIGTDTYLNIPKLYSYIHQFDSLECLYIGGHGCERQIGLKKYYFHSGGPGFIITYTTLNKLYNLLPTIVEDWTDICNKNKIDLIPYCDVTISYYLQQPSINVKIIKTNDLSFLHCNYKGNPCHGGLVDVKDIISCHLMNENDFFDFTTILNNNNHFLNP